MPEFEEPKAFGIKVRNDMKQFHEKFIPNSRIIPGTSDGVYDYQDIISPLKMHSDSAPV